MTYEYLCRACGHQWEAEQPISADPLKDCPQCGQPEAQRQISRGGGFILKGGGWYSDLYSSPSGGQSSDGESKTESGSNGKSTGTSSDKPKEGVKASEEPAAKSGSADGSSTD